METGEPPPKRRGQKVQTRNEETKWMLPTKNLVKRRGVQSLAGSRLKKVPRFNSNTTQRAGPPPLRKQLVPPITDICVGIFKMHLRDWTNIASLKQSH